MRLVVNVGCGTCIDEEALYNAQMCREFDDTTLNIFETAAPEGGQAVEGGERRRQWLRYLSNLALSSIQIRSSRNPASDGFLRGFRGSKQRGVYLASSC